jgi:phosphopantothenoylcysteine decarboxylase/phosphopantothenate--cysteine ligase
MGEGALAGRMILLGVSGSIAAYKAADLASRLVQAGAEVHVALTEHGAAFVGPATFRALTGNPVLTGVLDEPYPGRMAHIDIAQSADVFVVAPATANIIAKMACGIADDALSTLLLATTAPVVVAPAMNTAMLDHEATQANLATLRARGIQVVEPDEGRLACGAAGRGRLASVDTLVAAVQEALKLASDLDGCRILVTAGATREPIDPVRFISNRSSGKMGCALAAAAQARGAKVTLIAAHMTAAPTPGARVTQVSTTREMLEACEAEFDHCDVFIGAAAPCDFSPEHVEPGKISKSATGRVLDLRLTATPDIIASLAARKGDRLVVGFAAETSELESSAQRKLSTKGLDLIVANDVAADGSGFEVDTNAVLLLHADGRREQTPLLPKRQIADRVLDAVVALRASTRV